MALLDDSELQMMQQEIALTRDLTGQDGNTQARKILQDGVVNAARSVVSLAMHADKESVRFQAAVYVLERNLGRIQDNPPTPVEDPYMDLVERCIEKVYEEEPNLALVPVTATPEEAPNLESVALTEQDEARQILHDAMPDIFDADPITATDSVDPSPEED